MATIWNSPFLTLPANNQIVWIRVISVYGQLGKAKWKAAQQKFIVQGVDIDIPVYMVSRWKPL
jgi:hypothetical protein